jgi:mRNA interferase MazF
MRPALVISPDEPNEFLRTVIVAPMTTAERPYPTRVPILFQKKRGQVALDQLRALDRQRLVRKLGAAAAKTAQAVSSVLVEMFARSYSLAVRPDAHWQDIGSKSGNFGFGDGRVADGALHARAAGLAPARSPAAERFEALAAPICLE